MPIARVIPASLVEPVTILPTTSGAFKALKLDGATDYASIAKAKQLGLNINDGDFFALFLVKSDIPATSRILSMTDSGSIGWELYVPENHAQEFKLHLYIRDDNSGVHTSGYETTEMSRVAWNTMGMFADRDGNALFFLNGQADGTVGIGARDDVMNPDIDLHVGRYAASATGFLKGMLGRFLICNVGFEGFTELYGEHGFGTIAALCADIARLHDNDSTFTNFAEIGYPELDMTVPFYRQLVLNNSFETYTGTQDDATSDTFTSWTTQTSDGKIEATALTVYDGSNAIMLTQGASLATLIIQNLTVRPNKTYRLIFYNRGDGTNSPRYRVWDLSNGAFIIDDVATGNAAASYDQLSTTFTTPSGCTSIQMRFRPADVNGAIAYFDFVKVYIDESEFMDHNDCEETNLPHPTGGSATSTRCTIARSSDVAHNGTYSMKVTCNYTGTSNFRSQPDTAAVPSFVGKMFEVSVWVYVPTAGGVTADVSLSSQKTDWSGDVFPTVVTSTKDAWVQLRATFVCPSDQGLHFMIHTGSQVLDATQYFYYDELYLHQVGCVADWDWSNGADIGEDGTVNENDLTLSGSNYRVVNVGAGGIGGAISPCLSKQGRRNR